MVQFVKKKVFSDFYFFPFKLGHQASRLSRFSTIFKNKVFVNFFDFGWLDMVDIAYSGSTNCSPTSQPVITWLEGKIMQNEANLAEKNMKMFIFD